MKTHTTNYYNTFIEVAEDATADCGTPPPSRGINKTVAEMQYEMMANNPYKYNSDEVLFLVFAKRNDFPESTYTQQRKVFFSKGQACLRSSPLAKTYGFGIHSNHAGKVALYGMETEEYQHFLKDAAIKKVKAMRRSRR